MGSTTSRVILLAGLAAMFNCLTSCSPEPEEPKKTATKKELSDDERARRIGENRGKARDLLDRYRASSEQDFGLLQEYAELHRENTRIAPDPRCWAEYGEALSMLGWAHCSSYEKLIKRIEERNAGKAGSSELKELEREAGIQREEWVRYFTLSNDAYERYFQMAATVHPHTYERVMRHHELLGDFQQALEYLDKTVKSYTEFFNEKPDEKTLGKYEKLRNLYLRELVKKERSPGEPSRIREN